MPLRDHFRPPASRVCPWEGVHGQWPGMMVLSLNRALPPRYVAAPRIHHGSFVELDVSTYEKEEPAGWEATAAEGNGGVATAVWAPPAPVLSVECDLPNMDEYEVRVYDQQNDRRLVAAVEIISPANKDRPAHRQTFVGKCAALLQNHVSVTIIDVVTEQGANLFRELLHALDLPESAAAADAPLYVAACRYREYPALRWRFESWAEPLEVGRPLPILPLWLTDELAVPLELEDTYEATCRALRIS
jgi:hypothetical protein